MPHYGKIGFFLLRYFRYRFFVKFSKLQAGHLVTRWSVVRRPCIIQTQNTLTSYDLYTILNIQLLQYVMLKSRL